MNVQCIDYTPAQSVVRSLSKTLEDDCALNVLNVINRER